MSTVAVLSTAEPAIKPFEAVRLRPTLAQQTSVVVVAYNSGDALQDCIASIRRTEPEVEIVLVDNASTDGAVGRVRAEYPSVRVLRSDENLGFGGGNNLGAAKATGRFLVFLNPDTAVEPNWLGGLLEPLRADPHSALVTSKVLQMDAPDVISACGLDLHYTGLALARANGMHRNAFPGVEEVAAVSGASFAVRREVFEKLGGFDPAFFLYMEDVDLSLRASLAGYRILYTPQSVVYHDYTLHFGPAKTFYQERNRYLMLLKSLQWGTLLFLLPALLVAEMVTWGFVLLREKRNFSNKLKAYGWVLSHWPDILDNRRSFQALRRIRDRDLIARCTHRLAYEQTGGGSLARLARLIIDPLFFIFQRLALLLIWW